MKVAIICFPGSNRERDMRFAFREVTGRDPEYVWYADTELPPCDLAVIPGGFSHGDYLRAGAIAARAPIIDDVTRKAANGLPVLGVCNGFQILTEAGLLPGALMRNRRLNFICTQVHLKVERVDTLFTKRFRQGAVIRAPIAHHDGNYFADDTVLAELEAREQVVFRYCNDAGALTEDANPNGSRNNIAGIVNRAGNVLGMMPHPENFIETHLTGDDCCPLFESVMARVA